MAHIERRTLSDWVARVEAEQAPGSETRLLVEYRHHHLQDHMNRRTPIPTTEAAWWVGAYCAQEAWEQRTEREDGEVLYHREPQPADIEALTELLGREQTDDELEAMCTGYTEYLTDHVA